jgi:hypothetical protein
MSRQARLQLGRLCIAHNRTWQRHAERVLARPARGGQAWQRRGLVRVDALVERGAGRACFSRRCWSGRRGLGVGLGARDWRSCGTGWCCLDWRCDRCSWRCGGSDADSGRLWRLERCGRSWLRLVVGLGLASALCLRVSMRQRRVQQQSCDAPCAGASCRRACCAALVWRIGVERGAEGGARTRSSSRSVKSSRAAARKARCSAERNLAQPRRGGRRFLLSSAPLAPPPHPSQRSAPIRSRISRLISLSSFAKVRLGDAGTGRGRAGAGRSAGARGAHCTSRACLCSACAAHAV